MVRIKSSVQSKKSKKKVLKKAKGYTGARSKRLRNAGIKVDRKILADLAVNDPKGFKKLVDLAKKNLNA